MKEKEYLLNLLDYNSSANNKFFKIIITLSIDEINKQRKSFMNSIRNSLNHLLVLDKIWLANMKKQKRLFNNLQTILYENIKDLIGFMALFWDGIITRKPSARPRGGGVDESCACF